MKTLRKIALTFFILIFVVLLFKIINGFRELNKLAKNQLPTTYTLTHDDSDILSPKYIDNIKVDEVLKNKLRNPVTLCTYDSAFNLIIYQIDLQKDSAYNFKLKNKVLEVESSVGVPYEVINNSRFALRFEENSISVPTDKIILNYNGDLAKQDNYNDTLKYVKIKGQKVSIKYDEDLPIHILLEAKNAKDIELLFYRRKKKLFFLAMIPDSSNLTMPNNLLYNIVMKK